MFGRGGLTIGGEGGWTGFGGVWFGWTHVRLVIVMELKRITITFKKREKRERKKEKGGQIEIHVEKEKAEMKSLIALTA